VRAAEDLAWRTDLYTMEPVEGFGDDPLVIDRMWTRVEQGLAASIDLLGEVPAVRLDAALWADILVPFIIQLFVRDPDWEVRLEARLAAGGLGGMNTRATANVARVLEQQRISSAVLRAEWTVLRPSGSARFVTNDRGFAPMHHIIKDADGYVFPLKSDLALALLATKHQQCLFWDRTWFIDGVEEWELEPDAVDSLNATVWEAADREIYGHSRSLVAKALGRSASGLPWARLAMVDGAQLLGGTSRTRRRDEYMLLDVREFIRTPPVDSKISLQVDEVPAVPWRSGDRRDDPGAGWYNI
jgi:hypothetical protein